MVRTVALAVALSCAAFASPALANDDFVNVQGRVSYAGLNFDNPSDLAEFDKRVARTAKQICRRGVPKDLQYSRLVNNCRESVRASGKQQLAALTQESRGQGQPASGE